jgi:hypothetical protein
MTLVLETVSCHPEPLHKKERGLKGINLQAVRSKILLKLGFGPLLVTLFVLVSILPVVFHNFNTLQ